MNNNLPPKCFFNDSRNGQIDILISTLNKIEISFFSLRKDKLSPPWWDFVRYIVINNICIERGIYASHKSINIYKKSKFEQLDYSFKRIFELFLFINTLFKLRFKSISNIYISSRSPSSLFKINKKTLIIGNQKSKNKNLFVSKIILDKLIFFYSQFLICPKIVKNDISKIDEILKKEFKSNLNFKNIMVNKYSLAIASIHIWKFLFLLMPNIKKIGYINDDKQKGLVFLANNKKIKTCEIQHAYMGKSHEAFAYPKLDIIPSTIPKDTFLFFNSNDIVYPSNIINKGIIKKNKIKLSKASCDFDVLLGSSPRKSNETRELLTLINSFNLRVAIKLHPVESLEFFSYEIKNLSNKLTIFSGQEDFKKIAAKSIIYIPISHNSMSIFDAQMEGCYTIIFDPRGRKLTNMTDKIDPFYCYSKNSLVPLINYLLVS